MNEKLITYNQILESLTNNLSEMEKYMDRWEIRWYNSAIHYLEWIIDMLEFVNVLNITK